MNSNRDCWKKLIAIEGIDGAGTTTLNRRLTEELQNRSIPVCSGFEPTDMPIGRLIRSGIGGEITLGRQTLAMLFAADRREHLYGAGGIQEAINKGSFYITDRYFFSSLAYQSMDAPWEWVNMLNDGYPLPGLLIYLHIPASQAMKRIEGRDGRDIYETETQQNHVSELYGKSFKAYSSSEMRIVPIDSSQPLETMVSQALEAVMEHVKDCK